VKAGSRAAKLKAKRGRPFIEGVVREPNGRISRAKVPSEPANRLALEVRARQMGVSVEEARDPRVTTYIGRLYRLGKDDGLSREQYEAAQAFLTVLNDYRKAIQSPAAVYDERVARGEGMGEAEAAREAKARYETVMRVITQAQFEHRRDNLHAALQHVVIEDRELPHLIGTLRLLLNALARHFFEKS